MSKSKPNVLICWNNVPKPIIEKRLIKYIKDSNICKIPGPDEFGHVEFDVLCKERANTRENMLSAFNEILKRYDTDTDVLANMQKTQATYTERVAAFDHTKVKFLNRDVQWEIIKYFHTDFINVNNITSCVNIPSIIMSLKKTKILKFVDSMQESIRKQYCIISKDVRNVYPNNYVMRTLELNNLAYTTMTELLNITRRVNSFTKDRLVIMIESCINKLKIIAWDQFNKYSGGVYNLLRKIVLLIHLIKKPTSK